MSTLLHRHLPAALLICTLAGPSAAQSIAPAAGAPATVDLAVEAQHPAANDLAIATAYFEASADSPAAVARKVNTTLAAALETTRKHDRVSTQSGNTSTWPVYAKNGRDIETWRMRAELRLESRDIAALSELLGILQQTLAVSQIALSPAPETRRKARDHATVEAIREFEERARLVADARGKHYRIRHLGIAESGFQPPVVRMRSAAMMSAEAAPAPLEAGESRVGVSISGTIELLER